MIYCTEAELKAAIMAVVAPIVVERDYLHTTLMKTIGDYRATLLIATHEKTQTIKLAGALRDLITECDFAGLSTDGVALQNAREVLRAPVRQ